MNLGICRKLCKAVMYRFYATTKDECAEQSKALFGDNGLYNMMLVFCEGSNDTFCITYFRGVSLYERIADNYRAERDQTNFGMMVVDIPADAGSDDLLRGLALEDKYCVQCSCTERNASMPLNCVNASRCPYYIEHSVYDWSFSNR